MTQQVRHIAIVTPRRDAQSYTAHTDALATAMRTPGIALYQTYIQDLSYDLARNQLVQAVLQMRADMRKASPPAEIEGMIWIDDDVSVPPDVIPRLIGHQRPIVAGLYIARRQPFTPQMYVEAAGQKCKYFPILDWQDGALVKADVVGFGCVYVALAVIDAIAKRQMQSAWGQLRKRQGKGPEWFKFDWPNGEDFYFCEQAKECGFEVWVDTSIQCDHWGPQPITIDTFRAIRPKLFLVGPDGKPLSAPGEIAVAAQGKGQAARRQLHMAQVKAEVRRYKRLVAGGAGLLALLGLAAWRWRR